MTTRKYGTLGGAVTLLAWATIGTGGCTYDYDQFSSSAGAAGGDFSVGGNSSNQVAQGGTADDGSTQGGATFADAEAQGGTSNTATTDVDAGGDTSFGGTSALPDSGDSQGGGTSSSGGSNSTTVAQGGSTGGESPIGGTSSTGGEPTIGGTTSTQAAQGGTTDKETTGTPIATGGSGTIVTGQGGQTQDAGTGGTFTGGQGGAGGFDAEDGLVAHFAFDESTGTVATNSKDATKNGTYVGSCTHSTGQLGNAVGIRNLNSNSSGTSDWVELPAGLLSNLSATTLSIWVRDLSTNRTGGRLFDFSLGTADEIYFAPDDTNGTMSLAGGHLGGTHTGVSFVDLWTTTPVLTDKDWHQVVFTWNDAGIALYIDGMPAGSKTSPGVLPSDLGVTTPDWLGRTLDDQFIALYAEFDDLRIYNKVLLANEIALLYQHR
jgi:hypothetical protein